MEDEKIFRLIGLGFIAAGLTLGSMLLTSIRQERDIVELRKEVQTAWWKGVEGKAAAEAYKAELQSQNKRLFDLERKMKGD